MASRRREFIKCASFSGAVALSNASKPTFGQSPPRSKLPTIPYGAVYFRKTAPPSEDWERDYQQAAADGMDAFRHWFMWSAIEIAPGKYDWKEYDRQLDLAAANGITTIVGEILSTAPQWAFAKYSHARMEAADGRKVGPHYNNAAAVGGWPGLCLDNDDVLEVSEEFIRQLVLRYRQHPGMGGYDVWNELNHLGDAGGCWCDASAQKFRDWLRTKYGDLDTLGKAWYRYSYTDWDQVQIPRTIGPHPDSIDWGLFRVDNAMRIFERRVRIVRALDSNHPLTNHTIPLGAIESVFPGTYPNGGSYPVFQATRLVDITGFSGGGNHDDRYLLRWGHWAKIDITRSAACGKPFWAAEMTSGNTWTMASLKKLDEGRMTTAADIRFFTMMNLAGGVRGFFSPRWRPLLDGKTVGNFAFYAMDGSPTERSEMASEMIDWLGQDQNASLLDARPVASDLGILIVPESQIHDYCRNGNVDHYEDSVVGAYQGFLFNNLQVDFVPTDRISDGIRVLYLPYPVMLPSAVAEQLKTWVHTGGILISEGCPGYFGDRGRAGTLQPNHGLDELFGAKQEFIQLTPDLLKDLVVVLDEDGSKVDGGIYLQAFEPTTGRSFAKYSDGRIAGVENRYGQGKTRLLGTFPGSRLRRDGLGRNRAFYNKAFAWTGRKQTVSCSNPQLIARLQINNGDGRRYLWIVNSARTSQSATLRMSPASSSITGLRTIRGGDSVLRDTHALEANVPAREVMVLEMV